MSRVGVSVERVVGNISRGLPSILSSSTSLDIAHITIYCLHHFTMPNSLHNTNIPESADTQGFVARPVVDDDISVAPPTENSTAQSTAQASDIPSPTQQSVGYDVVQVKLRGARTWGDTKITCTKAGIETYANKSEIRTLMEGTDGRSAARVMEDMSLYLDSKIDDLVWSPSEDERMRAGTLKPTEAATYKAWAARMVPKLQKMA